MKYKVHLLPSKLDFHATPDENLLDAAQNQNIALEHSCKTGDCGTCSARLIQGSVLSNGQILATQNNFLTCNSKALSDLTIEAAYIVELAGIKPKTIPAKINSITQAAPDVLVIICRIPPGMSFDYLAGQYINLTFKNITRAYSIANAKSTDKVIHLHLRLLPDGLMSQALQTAQVNALLQIHGPHGTFFVRQDDRPLLFLAGGTGYAPIQAMIQQLLQVKDPREIRLYWAVKNESQFYTQLPWQWNLDFEQIHFVPSVSGAAENWQGRRGRACEIALEDIPDISNYQVYACGSFGFIETAKKQLTAKGLSSDAFFADAFTPAANREMNT